jgi:hypothetical protein
MSKGWKRLQRIDRRRALSLAVGAAVAPWPSWAQQGCAKLSRLGFLIPETVADQASRIEAMRAGLAERGWVEGRNLLIDMRAADGAYERRPRLPRNWRVRRWM